MPDDASASVISDIGDAAEKKGLIGGTLVSSRHHRHKVVMNRGDCRAANYPLGYAGRSPITRTPL